MILYHKSIILYYHIFFVTKGSVQVPAAAQLRASLRQQQGQQQHQYLAARDGPIFGRISCSVAGYMAGHPRRKEGLMGGGQCVFRAKLFLLNI